jgi:hypothetical protein
MIFKNHSTKQKVRMVFGVSSNGDARAGYAANRAWGRFSALAAHYVAGMNQAGVGVEREALLSGRCWQRRQPEGVPGCVVRQALHH